MKLLIGAAAFAAAGLVSAAPAAAENYYSIGLGLETIKMSHLTDPGPPVDLVKDAGVPVVNGRVGWKSDQWYGVEAEAAIGIGAGDPITNSANVGLRHSFGLYGVASYPVMEGLSVHARAGVVYNTSKLSDSGTPYLSNESGLSYGVGATYTVNTELTLRFDYTHNDIDHHYLTIPATATDPAFDVTSKGGNRLEISVLKSF